MINTNGQNHQSFSVKRRTLSGKRVLSQHYDSSPVPFIISELLGDLLAEKPKESDGVESVIIVDQLPVVEEARLTKLKQVINKLFSGFGNIVSTYYPQVDQEIEDDKGKRTVKMTKG